MVNIPKKIKPVKDQPKANFAPTISKEELMELPVAQYQGNVTLIQSTRTKAYQRAIELISNAEIIGIDTESKPSFVANRMNTVALLQIAVGESECFLFRLNKMGFPVALREIMGNPAILKIGLSLRDDISVLKRLEKFSPKGFVDLQKLCPAYGIQEQGLQRIYAIIFGEYMSKGQRMSNWEAKDYSPAQIAYAAQDAYAPLRIYHELMKYSTPEPYKFALL